MKHIAEALVFAVTYIDSRQDPDEIFLGEDVKTLETIAHLLQDASDEELDALAESAEQSYKEILSRDPMLRDKAALEDYKNWMEDMFVEGWKRNKRVKVPSKTK